MPALRTPSWASTLAAARAGHAGGRHAALRQRRAGGCNWLVLQPRRALRVVPPHPHAAGRRRRRRARRRSRDRRGGQAPARVPARRARAPGPSGLAFDMLSSAHGPVTTGHADGVITLDLSESDDVHRERMRERARRAVPDRARPPPPRDRPLLLADPRRADAAGIDACRALFGDEREDYQAALDRHYANGPPAGWAEAPRERVRHHAPVGGLGRDLRALPAHPRHAADRGRLRGAGSTAGADVRAARASRADFARRRGRLARRSPTR